MAQTDEISRDTEPADGRDAPSSGSHTPAIHTARVKLAAAIVVAITALLTSALIYSDQADLYESSFAVSIIRQITAENEFQPLYLVIILAPVFVAAARNVSWLALVSGGLIMLSILLPQARFEFFDTSSGTVDGAHNSLFQLAGPGHRMPEFVSVLALTALAGVTALFWRVRIGGLVAVMAAVTTAFVWPAVFDEPPLVDGSPLIVFQSENLLFGYYVAWFGAIIAVIGEGSLLARLTGRGRSNGDAAGDALAE